MKKSVLPQTESEDYGFYSTRDVMRLTTLSKSTLVKLQGEGKFPKAVPDC